MSPVRVSRNASDSREPRVRARSRPSQSIATRCVPMAFLARLVRAGAIPEKEIAECLKQC